MRFLICLASLIVAAIAAACSSDTVVEGPTTTVSGATGGAGGQGAAGATGGSTSTGGATSTGGSGGTHAGGGSPGDCPGGYCRLLVMSSCGDPSYEASPMTPCTTLDGQDGYCCFPPDHDGGVGPCGASGGYCTTMNHCQDGYVMTQMGCDIGDQFGSCCIPDPNSN